MVFDDLFRNNYRRMYLYAYELMGDREMCRDIVSDVFANIWKNKLDVIDDISPSYLMAAIKNACTSSLRHIATARKYEEEYLNACHEYNMDDVTSKRQDMLVRKMLDMVPSPPTREILTECYLNRKTYKKVAEQMGISPDTVKKHIIKSLKLLREAFAGKNMEDFVPDFDS